VVTVAATGSRIGAGQERGSTVAETKVLYQVTASAVPRVPRGGCHFGGIALDMGVPSSRRHDLEIEFRAQLNQPRRLCAHYLSERRAVDIAVNGLRSEKLGVVKNVETLEPKLQRLGF
jgi:hypothetical protein